MEEKIKNLDICNVGKREKKVGYKNVQKRN